jgi:putative CocE/NonD family hydrolase
MLKWCPSALSLSVVVLLPALLLAQAPPYPAEYIRESYTKQQYRIAMRDGVHLFTTVYSPKDTSRPHPMLMLRTPYNTRPYEKDAMPDHLGPSPFFLTQGYIFVYQDVRGRFLSEGTFVNMRPHIDDKKGPQDIDESSDTYDTIEWLINHVPNHNGRVGQWGISYPGFYSSAGMIDHHPALKAVSPQAPIADWFFDDFRHHGAFFLPHAFDFLAVFGQPRPEPTTEGPPKFNYGTPDGFQFYLDLGPLKNVNTRYFHHRIAFWDEMAAHPNYDAFWQARNLLPHLKKVAPAVMTVGGWFDAEDLYGTLKTYRALEKQNPGIFNILVMGPWRHGGWAMDKGDRLGDIVFGSPTAHFFQEKMELAFFNHFLQDEGELRLPEAYIFETGANRWREFDHWPPRGLEEKRLYFHSGGRLSFDPPAEEETADEYVSDPQRPVPYTEAITTRMSVEYMTADQRFAARHPDVLAYQTDLLKEDVTLAGALQADLWVSTSGTDSDWIVKLIDVFPSDVSDYQGMAPQEHLGNYEMMVRSEVIRGRFRDSNESPKPFVPNLPTHVPLELQDVLHTFGKGHRIMIQVQSTWFPLVDRNPQRYVPIIHEAEVKDFIKATQRVYHAPGRATAVQIGVLSSRASS